MCAKDTFHGTLVLCCLMLQIICIRQEEIAPLVPTPCPVGFFPCNSSDLCVERRRNCDGQFDCPGGSDEWACEDRNRKNYYDQLFKKRPDADREQNMSGCELRTTPNHCHCSKKSLFCNHRNMRKIPLPLPEYVQELDMSGNKLHILQKTDFPVLRHLHTLILTSSEVILIKEEAVGNLVDLKQLYLTSNRISEIPNATFHSNVKLKLLVLSHNPLTSLSPGAFVGLIHLEELDLRDCDLHKLSLNLFDDLIKLKVLWLDGNKIQTIPSYLFHNLRELQVLSLSRNELTDVEAKHFIGLRNLKSLSISKNKLRRLHMDSFGNLSTLLKLDLFDNNIYSIDRQAFLYTPNIKSLNLKRNSFKMLKQGTFDDLWQLRHIYFDEFGLCSSALHVRICEPRGDGISSVVHLLASAVLRWSVWGVAATAGLGNAAVLVGRYLLHEPNAVHSFYIRNLAAADLLMGIYLAIIGWHDITFRGNYIRHEAEWRRSWACGLCGFLSTLSSEASILILTVITVDRYTSILYPLSLKRRNVCSAAVAMIGVWGIAILLSALPLLMISYFGEKFYGNNGVCLPLQIHDPFGQGWEYSTFLFCGLNLSAFLFILFAYIAMFFTISRSRIGLRSTQQLQDRTIAQRFAFIVGTDFLCWVPIIFIKLAAMAGVSVHEDLYAWVAVFLLPVNSALNPILYTLTTKLFRQHLAKLVYSCRAPRDSASLSLTSVLHHQHGRNSTKKSLVSTFSERENCSGHRTSLLVAPSPACKRKTDTQQEDML